MKDHHKMRAWNGFKYEYVFYYHTQVGPHEQNNNYDFLQLSRRDWEIELCTGLKDKNGKLIYEKDIDSDGFIVTYVCDTEENLGMEIGYYLVSKDGKHFVPMESRINKNNDNYEIIGNIHENPELLK